MFTPDEKKALHEKYPEAYPDDTSWYTGDNVQLAIGQGDVARHPAAAGQRLRAPSPTAAPSTSPTWRPGS